MYQSGSGDSGPEKNKEKKKEESGWRGRVIIRSINKATSSVLYTHFTTGAARCVV